MVLLSLELIKNAYNEVLLHVSYPLVGFVTRRLHLVDLIEMRSLKSAGHKSNQRVRNAQEYLIVSILNQF